ncbi:MAG TPA: SDR family oxidoreductase, partial [Candidatus Dormibacteraeota bacterium]|nr:SDR family oxidoreductase [Candidatus Dormibacteraeota bacterium]
STRSNNPTADSSAKSVEAGRALAAELPDALYFQADVSDDGAARAMVAATLERYGRLDVLVNNAGTTEVIPHADLDAATDEVWDRILSVNLMGTWHVIRAALASLRRDGGGCVINMTSLAGVAPVGSSIPYAVSKAALNHLTRLLANALGPEVRVNAVAPGLIDTPWTQDWAGPREHWRATAPLGRTGTPEDIAGACLYLADATFVTGQVIVADGGMNLRVGT